jgi:hypothetical protein
MHDVMISYSSIDKIIADAICNQLESKNIRVWIAPRDMLGRTYLRAIKDGIKNATIIVLVFSANSNNSTWVPRELERGVSYGKIIIPFKLEEVLPLSADIELCTSLQHWIDAITPPIEKNIRILVNTVERLLQPDSIELQKKHKDLSPLGEIYKLATRWAHNKYEYFVIEGVSDEIKSILRTAPKSINIADNNALLFLMIASVHFGGVWCYWQKKIKDPHNVVEQLTQILKIPYFRPRLRALYALQSYKKELIKEKLLKAKLDNELKEIFNKYVFTKKMDLYINKLLKHNDPQVVNKTKNVLQEIKYCQTSGKKTFITPMPSV